MRIFQITTIIFLFTSCGDKVEREELIGQYVFNMWDRDTLELYSDGRYLHYNVYSGKRIENSGTWELNKSFNEVEFDNFTNLAGDGLSGTWPSRVKVDGDEIHLMYADDINAFYNKLDTVAESNAR